MTEAQEKELRQRALTKCDALWSYSALQQALIEFYKAGYEDAEKIRLKANASCGRGMQIPFNPED